jgi:methionyl-tRNA synthetase
VDGDTNFDWDKIRSSYNSHLANNLGNLLMRVTNLVEKNMNGQVNHDKPDLEKMEGIIDSSDLEDSVKEVFKNSLDYDFLEAYNQLNDLNVRGALDVVLVASDFGNNLLEKTKPWTLFKEGKEEEGRAILEYLVFLLKNIGDLLSIFLPESGAKIYETVNLETIKKADPLFKKVEIE